VASASNPDSVGKVLDRCAKENGFELDVIDWLRKVCLEETFVTSVARSEGELDMRRTLIDLSEADANYFWLGLF
jgi:hypothetical protein